MTPVRYDDLTQSERRRVREKYVQHQQGRCAYCGRQLHDLPEMNVRHAKINWTLFPRGRGFLDYPVHLHHDRKTGLTIGAVHALCNAYMWQFLGE